MRDFHPTQPQFLAILQPVNIKAGAGANRGDGCAKIAGIGQFVQGFVSIDEGNGKACRLCHLRIIASGCGTGPVAVGGQNIGIAKGLRRLHPAQRLATGGGAHLPVRHGMAQAINHRHNRDGAGLMRQRIAQPLDHRARQDGAGRIMNQHLLRCMGGQRLQPATHRILPGDAAGHALHTRNAGQRLCGDGARAFGNDNDDRGHTGRTQRFG